MKLKFISMFLILFFMGNGATAANVKVTVGNETYSCSEGGNICECVIAPWGGHQYQWSVYKRGERFYGSTFSYESYDEASLACRNHITAEPKCYR